MLEMLWNIRQGTVTAVGLQSPNVFAVVMKEVEYGLTKPDHNPPVHATRPNPPPPAEIVSQFHYLAKNHQAPFGGARGHLQRNKSVALDVFPRPVLAPKPHQEHVMNIEEFIWRVCVSFRRLNRVAKPFTFPITRCADAIEDIGAIPFLILWFISLDCRQGFHQISIRHSDQEKLHFYPGW
jgi:hypothetical protein